MYLLCDLDNGHCPAPKARPLSLLFPRGGSSEALLLGEAAAPGLAGPQGEPRTVATNGENLADEA